MRRPHSTTSVNAGEPASGGTRSSTCTGSSAIELRVKVAGPLPLIAAVLEDLTLGGDASFLEPVIQFGLGHGAEGLAVLCLQVVLRAAHTGANRRTTPGGHA